MSLTILVDVDETAAHMLREWTGIINEDYGTEIDYKTIDDWNLNLFVPKGCNINAYFAHPELYSRVQPKDGFAKCITELKEQGHTVLYVSSCPRGSADDKVEWLYRHAPGFKWEDFISCYRKHLIKGDLLIDDGPHNLTGAPEDIRTIRFMMPYNKGVKANAHADNWHNMRIAINYALFNEHRYSID